VYGNRAGRKLECAPGNEKFPSPQIKAVPFSQNFMTINNTKCPGTEMKTIVSVLILKNGFIYIVA
jgi:hypothetical protein